VKTLSIDVETFSSIDLKKSGMYKYVEAPDFEIMLFAFSRDGEEPKCVDLTALEEIPQDVVDAIFDSSVLKYAYNAPFERTTLAKHFGRPVPPESWWCTMIQGAMCGLPLGLAQVGSVLKLDMQKDMMGAQLIRYFCIPCKPTKTNGGRTRNMPWHDTEKWEAFKKYCIRDVVVEQKVAEKLSFYVVPEVEKKLWYLDQKINDTGVLVDLPMVRNAIEGDRVYRDKLVKEAIELTGLSNPNSNAQLKEWLELEINEEVITLKKDAIPDLIKGTDDKIVKRVLAIRQELSKTSVKKYQAMLNTVCADGRIRGLFQFYGANRTGRNAGRLVQMQNLPRSSMNKSDLEVAREIVLDNDFDLLELLYGNVPDTLSQLIRTAFIATTGNKLIVCDYSNIELIVAAWLAGEKWVLDEFMGARKIYEQAAARMLRVPVETIKKDSPERQKGKVTTLLCQYGGGVKAMIKGGALKMGLTEDDLPENIELWRKANPNIVKYWKTVEDAAITCVSERRTVKINFGITFSIQKGVMFITLPSGRKLSYVHPVIKPGKFGSPALAYEGMDQTTKQWKLLDTWGGKIFENICQAVARDVQKHHTLPIDKLVGGMVADIHDEDILEVYEHLNCLKLVEEIMSTPIPWAPGLPLAAEGFESKFYRK
jgi:DNA polymerase